MPTPPNWSEAPEFDPARITLRLLRTPHDRAIDLLPTSRRPIGTFTHFHQRRTIPCSGLPDCPLCLAGHPARWHGFIAALLLPHREHIIWQYTAPLAHQIGDYLAQAESLRGSIITAKRIAPYPNARITIWIRPAGNNTAPLPDPPDLPALLCRIWDVPNTNQTPNRLTEGHADRFTPKPDDVDPRYKPHPNGKERAR